MLNKELREKLADLQHQQWSGWMDYLFSKCTSHQDIVESVGGERGELIIPKWTVDRWTRQLKTNYADLPEDEKESDRIEADRYEPIITKLLKAQRAADYEAVEKELKDTLTVDVDAVEWVDESKKWKDGIEPCFECSNAEKIRTALAAIKKVYEQDYLGALPPKEEQ